MKTARRLKNIRTFTSVAPVQHTLRSASGSFFFAMANKASLSIADQIALLKQQVQSGRYSSASEVIRAALRMFEKEEIRKKELIEELKVGEKSGFNEDFDKNQFMKILHLKYKKNEI